MDAGHLVELVSNITVIVASAVAIAGLSTWKRELKGKRDMELAEDVLGLFYRAEWAIKAIRFPVWDLREGQTREAQADEAPEQKEARDRAYVVFKRMRDNSDTFSELHTLRFRFMARFGRDKAKPFDEVDRILSEMSIAAEELAQLWEEQLKARAITESTKDEIKEFKRVIWSHGTNDEIMSRLRAAVENIENVCRPIINEPSPWLSRPWRKTPIRARPEES